MAEPAKPKLLGGTAIKPPERHGFEKISYLIYNKDNGEILTRTPKSWALIFIFYVIYYTLLGKIHIGMSKKNHTHIVHSSISTCKSILCT